MPDKRPTFNPIDTMDGFIAANVGSTTVEDPAWETLFSDTALELPKGFYMSLYEITMRSDTIQKPVEARILYNGVEGVPYHAVMTAADEQETVLLMTHFGIASVRDVLFDFQFRNGTGGGGGATLTVDRIEYFVQMQSKRHLVPPFFIGVGTISEQLGIQLS